MTSRTPNQLRELASYNRQIGEDYRRAGYLDEAEDCLSRAIRYEVEANAREQHPTESVGQAVAAFAALALCVAVAFGWIVGLA
jgi:hypothetical protein